MEDMKKCCNSSSQRRFTGYVLAILCLIILVGCAKKDAIKKMSDEDALRERAGAYWGYVVKEAFDKTYELELPLYRKNVSMVEYLRGINNNVRWTKVDIAGLEISGDAASVKIVMDTAITGAPVMKRGGRDAEMKGLEKIDKWTRLDGVWYHVPKKFRADN